MAFDDREVSATGGQPYQLFEFLSGPEAFYYTTADRAITVGSVDYLPTQPMRSAEIKETTVDDKGKLNFEVMRDHEIAQLFLVSNPRPITLIIKAGHYGEGEHTVAWTGRVVGCEWNEEDVATISCESVATLLSRNGLPYKFGATCQHSLYRGGCKLNLFDPVNSQMMDIVAIDGYTLRFDELVGADPNDYDGGLVIVGGVDYRMTTSLDAGTGTLTLFRPFEYVEVGDNVRVARGCNRTPDRCKELNNFENFLGFTTVPTRNPFNGLRSAGVIVENLET